MLCSNVLVYNLPVVHLTDEVGCVMEWMDEYNVQHLPVEDDGKYAGLVSYNDLLNADEAATIAAVQDPLNTSSVLPGDHFLAALKLVLHAHISVVAVVSSEKVLEGVITEKELLYTAANFYGLNDGAGGMITLEMDKRHFSFGELCRLVETNDAQILQLNTYEEKETGSFIVTIKLNRLDISNVVATLQRYEYNIRYYFGEEMYENELKRNYEMLMNYLSI